MKKIPGKIMTVLILLLIIGVSVFVIFVKQHKNDLTTILIKDYGNNKAEFFSFSNGEFRMEFVPENTELYGFEMTFAQCKNLSGTIEIVVAEKNQRSTEGGDPIAFMQVIHLDELVDNVNTPLFRTDMKLKKNKTYILSATPKDVVGEPLLFLESIPFYYEKTDLLLLKTNVLKTGRKNSWYEKHNAIAHGLGGINGIQGINCMEGFELAYQNGFRIFETDMILTADGKVVLRHDWENPLGQDGLGNGSIPTKQEFLDARMNNIYTPMSLEDLLELMILHEDIYVVTDVKNPEEIETILKTLVNETADMNRQDILERFIIQLYDMNSYEKVNSVYSFSEYILTLYLMTDIDYAEVADYCKLHEIDVVTMPNFTITELRSKMIRGKGLKLFGHTYNDKEYLMEQSDYIDGYYTDFLSPDDLNHAFSEQSIHCTFLKKIL